MNERAVYDIFLSYDHDDIDRVSTLVQQLTAAGWKVWWDRGILPGQTWDEVISRYLKAARCVVVVWTRDSVKSDWVRIEANNGRERDALVPVRLDEVELPLAFQLVQTASLIDWDYRSLHPGLDALMAGIRAVISRNADALPAGQPSVEEPAGEARAVDAAIGRQLVVNQPASLIAMVRLASSAGLRALLGPQNDYQLQPEDVSSRPFDLVFPLDSTGKRLAAELAIRVYAPTFDPPEQRKKMRVTAERDSTVFEFLVTPRTLGNAVVQIEIYEREVCLASRILRPSCVEEQILFGREIVSMPMSTTVTEQKAMAFMAAAAAGAGGGPRSIDRYETVAQPELSPPAKSFSGRFTWSRFTVVAAFFFFCGPVVWVYTARPQGSLSMPSEASPPPARAAEAPKSVVAEVDPPSPSPQRRPAGQSNARVEEKYADLSRRLDALPQFKASGGIVSTSSGALTIRIPFESGDATVRKEAQSAITGVAELLSEQRSLFVMVEGHTDSTGGAAVNEQLALERASSAAAELSRAGVATDQILSHEFGSALPITDNDTEAGRAQNRRVEITIADRRTMMEIASKRLEEASEDAQILGRRGGLHSTPSGGYRSYRPRASRGSRAPIVNRK